MRPPCWQPPVDLSPAEQRIVRRIRRAKLFVFLRQLRHEFFDAAFQAELATLYQESPKGHSPMPPAQLALATILQAYTGVSDDEVIEATVMDRRRQLVLDCLDCPAPPFSKGTLVAFRQRLITHDGDRRLIERTISLAAAGGGFSRWALHAALDSSPLWGADKVEDTYNLLGHALRKALGVLARQQGWGLAKLAVESGAAVVGGTSLKATLELDWDDPTAREQAPIQVLAATTPTAHDMVAQDVAQTPEGPRLRRGVAKERRISLEDPEMRHGRKSRAQRVDGYKRHGLRDLDTGLIRAGGVTAANLPEARVTEVLAADLAHQAVTLRERHLDRAYLSSHFVRERPRVPTLARRTRDADR